MAAYQSQPEGLTHMIDELRATIGQMAHCFLVGLPQHFTQWESLTADHEVDIRA
jgi:beta-xylosidase